MNQVFVSGMVSKHNCRIWAANNLFITVEAETHSFKINVWCAMSI